MPKSNQVVVRLSHGLGNQLFQYALGRKLAIERKAQLFLDASWYTVENCPRPDRPLALSEFNPSGEITFDGRWKSAWLAPTVAGKLQWMIERHLPPSWRKFVEEDVDRMKSRGQAFDRRIFRARAGAYFCGYWVSPLYFEGVEDQLRKELVLRQQPDGRYPDYLARIRESESVAVHVRRGDIRNYPAFGVLDAAYYGPAVAAIRKKTGAPRFFVFSDTVSEARQVMDGIAECEYVELGADASPAHDLSLMAACRHFIIANSTFSWWGAWLSQHPDKVVLVPDKWLPGISRAVDDIYLPAWESIPVG
jgi:Glycosyl transferase family 11